MGLVYEKVGVAKILGLCLWPKGPKSIAEGLGFASSAAVAPSSFMFAP